MPTGSTSVARRVVVLVACLAASAVLVARSDRREDTPIARPLSELPLRLGEWHGVPTPPLTKDVLDVLGLSDYVTRAYLSPSQGEVGLYVGYWRSQRQGETIHSPLNCLPGSGWDPVSKSVMSLEDNRGAGRPPVPANRYIVEKAGERQLVVYWFQSHGRIVASEYASKLQLILDAARMNRTDGAIVRVIAPILGDGADAERRAESQARAFTAELLPQLNAFLPN
jgi:EpsI family protein